MNSPHEPTRSLPPPTLSEHGETLSQSQQISEPDTNSFPSEQAGDAPTMPTGFRLVKSLGEGGMGHVFEVVDDQLQMTYALKMAHNTSLSAIARERFRQEAKAMVDLDHPHIARIYTYGEFRHVPYLTMRYLRGGSLAGKVRELRTNPRAAVALFLKIISATAYLHERGFVHRDLKPHNVLLDEAGEPYVSDFGLVKSILVAADTEVNNIVTVPDRPALKPHDSTTPPLTATGAVLGTRVYMAPEQAIGQIDAIGPKTDVWAMGVMLYEILVGKRPFANSDHDELTRSILHDEPIRPTTVDPAFDRSLEAIILSCLAKNPDQRPTANELHRQLKAWLTPPRQPVPPATWPKWLAIGSVATIGLALVVFAALIILPILQRRAHQPATEPAPLTTDEIRQQLRAQLAQGEKVVLVDEQGHLRVPMNYLFDGDMIRSIAVGEDCTVDYSSLTYAELLENVGIDQYVLRGEVKCNRRVQRPQGGLYAGRQEFTSNAMTSHFLTEFRYTDPVRGPNQPPVNKADPKAAFEAVGKVNVKPASGVREALLRRITVPEATKQASTGKHQITMQGREFNDEQPVDGWRPIAVHVTDKRYSYEWNGATIAHIDRPLPDNATLVLFLNLKHPIDRQAVFTKPGGVGLIIQGGAVSFRNVTIEPANPK